MTKSIYSLARAVLGFFRADPPETPPTPPTGNVADLTGRITPLDASAEIREDHHLPNPRPTFGKRREPPPSWPFKTTRDGVACWTECGPGHCAYPGNCVASFRGQFIDTEGTRLPRGMARIGDGAPVPWPPVPVFDDKPLLRPVTAHAPAGCHCKGRCQAPWPHPCRDTVKALALARQERARATGRWPM